MIHLNEFLYNKHVNPKLISNEFADLGLPSKTLWRKFNLGANTETEVGNYYAWGETEPKAKYSTSTHKYIQVTPDGNNELTKYTQNSKLKELEPIDDAATQFNADWETPSKEQIFELLDNTNTTFVHKYNNKKCNGIILTSKHNGNSIFIPFSGVKGKVVTSEDTDAVFWGRTSNIKDNAFMANIFLYTLENSASPGPYIDTDFIRKGLPIRPVLK